MIKKGRIDKEGNLHRNGIPQLCLSRTSFFETEIRKCGAWCPMFGEPLKVVGEHPISGEIMLTGTVAIKLCETTLEFEDLIDERDGV
jgi:hypothetical protein